MPAFPDLPLRTERLILRPPVPDDSAAFFAFFSDPEAMRYWSTPPLTDPAEAASIIEQDRRWLAEGSALRLALEPAAGGPVVGAVSIFAFHEASARAEIGYILARSAWHRGLMHEALVALVGYAFADLGMRRLEADIDPANAASARSLARLGFRPEGLLRERWQVGTAVTDSALYGLLAREWRVPTPPCSRPAAR